MPVNWHSAIDCTVLFQSIGIVSKFSHFQLLTFYIILLCMFDLIIIGGGPAGVAAGVYAGRKKIKTLVLADSFGGQSIVSSEIQNWIGTIAISGIDLAQNLEKHLPIRQFFE